MGHEQAWLPERYVEIVSALWAILRLPMVSERMLSGPAAINAVGPFLIPC